MKSFGVEDCNILDTQQLALDFDSATKQLGLRSVGFAEVIYCIYGKNPEVDFKTKESSKMMKLYQCIPESFKPRKRNRYALYSWTGDSVTKLGGVQRRY